MHIPGWWPPKASPAQFRLEKRLWAASIPPTICWAAFFPGSWNRWGVEYVALLSVYALVKGAGSQEQAAEAKQTASELQASPGP